MPVLFLAMLLAATIAGSPSPAPARPAAAPAAPLSPDSLYSRRALRRARLLIQMRLMELSDERLECVREALRRRLPDALWEEVPSPSRGSADAAAVAARCADLIKL
jgi:hypothetical protein